MSGFLKVVAGCLMAVVLGGTLSKQNKDMWLLLGLAVSCMVMVAAVEFLSPVRNFMNQLQDLSGIDSQMIGIVIKSAGVGLVSEIAGGICADSGWSGIGKSLQIFSVGVILWLSIPLMEELVELVQKMVGQI